MTQRQWVLSLMLGAAVCAAVGFSFSRKAKAAPAHAAVFMQAECGYAGYRPCTIDPATYGQARTADGCRAAAIRAFGAVDGPKIKCVKGGR